MYFKTKGIVSITKIYSHSSSACINFGFKKLKELNFTDSKVKFVENIFLSILITNYKSKPFNLGEFEYVKNAELVKTD